MNNSQETANIIKSLTKLRGISINKLLSDCKLNKNALYTMQSGGYFPRVEALIKIADYLDCSIDYLLGRTTHNSNEQIISNNNSSPTINSIIKGDNSGNNSSNIILGNNDTKKNELSKQALELAEIFDNLGIRQQAKLLSALDELEKNKKNL